MNGPSATSLVEAVLLTSARPASIDALAAATGLPDPELQSALAILERRFSPENSGIVLRRVAGGYQLATNPACAAAVERLREDSRPTPLSNAALEVLSCALYLGPLTRGAVAATRGVNSDAVIRNLLDRDLLAEVDTDLQSPGAPALLDVTEEFLIATGAASREDFPPLDSLVSPEELARLRERLGAPGETPEEP